MEGEKRMAELCPAAFSAVTLSNLGQRIDSLEKGQSGMRKGQWSMGIEEVEETGQRNRLLTLSRIGKAVKEGH